jgi:hypothetical protein
VRTKIGMTVLAVLLTGAGFGLLPRADAVQVSTNTFTVEKVVVGPVPAGTVFEVTVQCTGDPNDAPSEGIPASVFQFDENGDPIGANSLQTGLFVSCTATETDDGGAASVSYACAVANPPRSPADEQAEGNSQVQCVDDQTVHYGEVVGGEGTITVTNTFEAAPPPDVEPDDVVPDVVNASPSFTG